MRAVVCHQPGPLEDLVVEEREPPVAAGVQVVVDVRAAGVNFVDGLFCQGRYQVKPPTPFVPGSEVAGVVVACGGDVTTVREGDRVIALTGMGGFAERVAASATTVLPLPASLTFSQGAALVQSYATVWFTLTRRTTIAPGEWALVLGAGGGVGLAATDVAHALGARVIAAASTDEKLRLARAAGAEATINYETEDLKARAREISGCGVDVVIDPVGGRHSEPALRATKFLGRYCVIGFASGPIPTVPLNQVLLNNRTVVGVDWGAWTMRAPGENQELLAELLGLVDEGRLHPSVPHERPLEDAAAVMAGLIDRTITGKVVLVP